MKIIKMHPKDAKDLNLNEGDLVRVTDEKSKSFDAKLEADFHLQGTVSYTSLFGEMVTDVSQSKDDWAPNIPDLDFKPIAFFISSKEGLTLVFCILSFKKLYNLFCCFVSI